jgi:tetratricopeptide (TPR) repeat protein
MPPSPSVGPRPEEVLWQLEDIASSGKVTGKPLKFLRYVVKEALEGRADNIKEYTVAVDGLEIQPRRYSEKDKPSDVRVHANTLREQLQQYYAMVEVWRVRILIDIPKGGYRPVFSYPDRQEKFSAAEADALRSAQVAADKLTLPGFQAALAHIDRILAEHPNHPLVLAVKADVHAYRAMHGMPPREEIETARRIAERAMALSPDLWQVQTAYGYVQAVLRHWDEARAAFDRAAALPKPADVPVHPSYTAFLVSQGQTAEAIRLTKQDVDSARGYYGGLAPSKPIVRADLGFLQLLAGQLEQAAQTLDAAINDSDFYSLYSYRAIVQEAMNDPAGALDILHKARLKWSETAVLWGMKGFFLARSGARWRARLELLKLRMLQKLARFYVPASQFALIYTGLGEHQKAIQAVRQMAEDCDPLILWLGHFPFFRHLAHLPEYHALLKELGLSWQWQRQEPG